MMDPIEIIKRIAGYIGYTVEDENILCVDDRCLFEVKGKSYECIGWDECFSIVVKGDQVIVNIVSLGWDDQPRVIDNGPFSASIAEHVVGDKTFEARIRNEDDLEEFLEFIDEYL